MTGEATQRTSRADITFIAASLVAGVVLLYLGRSLTFWRDEWRSITFTGSGTDFLKPVNEHWSTFPLLLYRITFEIFELRSYLPFLAELVVLHLLAVAGAYVLMRRRVGPVVATALTIPLLFLGSGSENLFWAFQTGFVGSVMFGLWAIVFIERPGRWSPAIASVLLLASLMSSGLGLLFLVASVGRTIFDPSLRIRVLSAIPPSAAYAVWYLIVGRESVSQLASLPDLVKFVVRGVAHSTGAITGLGFSPGGRLFGPALFAMLVIVTARAVIAGRPRALAAGCLLAVPAMYVLSGAVRALDCADCATRSRYVYVVGFLLVVSVADWLPALRARMSSLPYGWALGVGSLMFALVVSTAANIGALGANRAHFQYRADLTRAHIAIALAHRGESWIDPDVGLSLMPRVPVLLETVEKHGFPLNDSVAHDVDLRPRSRAYETALLGLVGDGFRVEPASRSGQPVPTTVVETDDLVAARAGECISLRGAGNEAGVTFSAAGGTRVRVTAASTVNGLAALARDWPPFRMVALELVPRAPLDILVPDTGDGGTWKLRLAVPGAIGRMSVCTVRVG